MFDDDRQIIECLTNDETFKGAIIDDEEHQAELKFDNFIPKGVRTLERMFDLNEKFRRPANVKTHSSSLQFKLINLGTKMKPKYVNLGKCCSPAKRDMFIVLFKRYKDVFSWMYEDLKTYDTNIIQHVIPIKSGIKPYQHPLRKMHPKLEPRIQSEVKKLLDARIIFKVRHSEWVSNLVPVGKKSREIKLCVDFRNLNRASDKDNYPIPPMEQILHIRGNFN